MSEAIQSKDEKEYAVRQCWGRCLRNSWQIAVAGLGRDQKESARWDGFSGRYTVGESLKESLRATDGPHSRPI